MRRHILRSATALALFGIVMPAACSLSTQGSEYDESGTSRAGSGGAGGVDATSGGTGGGSASSAGGGGSVGGPESCSDGIDNDGNGSADCADTSVCEKLVECVPSGPPGWTTYARFERKPFSEPGSPGKCPDGSEPKVLHAGPAASVQCSTCSCSWSGAACNAPEITCWRGSTTCIEPYTLKTEAVNTDCIPTLDFAAMEDSSCRLTAPATVSMPGTCAAQGGELGPAWAELVYVCPAPPSPGEGGCGAGMRCVPKGGGAFGGPACVTRMIAEGCPAGWSGSSVTSYGGADDTRACEACNCATGVSCMGGSYSVHGKSDCTGNMGTVTSTSCTNVTPQLNSGAGSIRATLATVVDGTCAGGAPSGSLNPKDPLTICCPPPSP